MNIIAGVDIETTGLEPGDHRIVQIYIGLYRLDGTSHGSFSHLINPERSISAEAERVHKISLKDVQHKPNWDVIGPKVMKLLSFNELVGIVWHNGDDFDGPFIDHELRRINLARAARPTLDTMKAGTWATPDGKRPTLQELSFACGVAYDPDKAHAADYDVKKMMECFFRARSWGFFNPSFASTPQPTPIVA